MIPSSPPWPTAPALVLVAGTAASSAAGQTVDRTLKGDQVTITAPR
ncbi:hypothetical protein AB0K12_18350 [Nonomuraea sp. NPDC049419]